ncbi:MAG: bifunctional aspartate kinase/diaminopimelate decarboxylase [Xanthomonadales bacterium]|nr:bifunctional aspartate kinase/diaminopimelate decarboxylase [Gammaproteobacteria bacterium]NND56356.1 bifunctional aspartate kinase/diaminopimelate decarboxylase [Xanthomonadales bacterium]NNK52896.1 bifunctional aspartate kinase/diaminopimelate decarboxylase [Xanthomonadales bacterium]
MRQKDHDHPWVVMKFGGTSVSSVECWSTICRQAGKHLETGHRLVIVVSALSGVTNLLTQLATAPGSQEKDSILAELSRLHLELFDQLGKTPTAVFDQHWEQLVRIAKSEGGVREPSERALIMAHGELLSSSIGHQVLESKGLDAVWQDARNLLQVMPGAGDDALAARCADHAEPALAKRLSKAGRIHITQGFIVGGPDGSTCLLGRGGSDTSAAYLAARLSASSLEIWTDVPGIFSADPRAVPEARLLRRLSYSEAQELASMGARVLHPPSIQPASRHGIPVFIKNTNRPGEGGTRIAARSGREEAQVKGVVSRENITLVNMENPAMWHQAGFLADAFAVFKRHGYSVDLISTSESTVTVSLDPQVSAHSDENRLSAFLTDLGELCKVNVHTGCISISLVGNSIRTILGRLSAALDVFQDRHVHMVTQSANDLNLTLVVDPEHALSLVRKLHQLLIASVADNRPEFGPSWKELTRAMAPVAEADPWWAAKAGQLHNVLEGRECAYVYDLETARSAARRIRGLNSVSRILYAVKANDHASLLLALADEGLGFECVSMEEVRHVLTKVPSATAADILFTPNFAPRSEYEAALAMGIRLTVDNSWAIRQWPDVFKGQDIFLRLDLDRGYGHHKKVITSGADSKFGISLEHLADVRVALAELGSRVVGLHAHTGSGVQNAEVWREQLERFLQVLPLFPDAKVLDLGGGLGVPDRRGQAGFDLASMNAMLAEAIAGHDVEIWLEPGRYLAAECGILLARVTQLKTKGQYNYLGIATGMNALIRPALYGAYHDIVNLTRLDQPAEKNYRVVGPICESGDVVGESRYLPVSEEGDIILIANAGAYGRVMSSSYNRRSPPQEFVL